MLSGRATEYTEREGEGAGERRRRRGGRERDHVLSHPFSVFLHIYLRVLYLYIVRSIF